LAWLSKASHREEYTDNYRTNLFRARPGNWSAAGKYKVGEEHILPIIARLGGE
jgi:hypothetical protein